MYHESMSSILSIFMPPSLPETELLEFLPQARRVASGFARRRGRGMDAMFVDEMIAEAYAIITILIMEKYDEITVNHPDREAFYRMSIGYGLKEYISLRSTSSISYLKKRGLVREHVPLRSTDVARNYSDDACFDIMESLCRDEIDKRVIELYSQGDDYAAIAVKLEISDSMVKKILRRIRKGLRAYEHVPTVSGLPRVCRHFRQDQTRKTKDRVSTISSLDSGYQNGMVTTSSSLDVGQDTSAKPD